MTSRTWFWKVAVSVLALAVAVYEFYPLSPTSLEEFIPTQVIKNQPAFEKIHAEAKKRFRDYKDAAVPADQKSVSYYQALRDIGEGKGRAGSVDLLPFFYNEKDFVREPDQSKRNILVLKQQLLASQGKLKLGLDLQGGVSFTLKVDPSGVENNLASVVNFEEFVLARVSADKVKEFTIHHQAALLSMKTKPWWGKLLPASWSLPSYGKALTNVIKAQPVDLRPLFFDEKNGANFVLITDQAKRNQAVIDELTKEFTDRFKDNSFEEFVLARVSADKVKEFTIHHQAALLSMKTKPWWGKLLPASWSLPSYGKALTNVIKAQPVDLRPLFFDEKNGANFVLITDQAKRNQAVIDELTKEFTDRFNEFTDRFKDISSMAPAQMVAQAITVMEQRVNAFGVAEPVIRPVGDLSLEVQLPGEDAANNPDIMDALKKPAKLEFRQVYRGERPAATDRERSTKALQDENGAIATYEVLTERNVDRRTGEVTTQRYYVRKKADATGKIIKSSSARSDDGLSFYVSMNFTDEGSKKFGDLTAKISEANNRGVGQLAIVLDGQLQSAPTVKEAIRSTSAQITGSFSREEALELASVLNNPLEFPLITQDVTSVGPSLAQDAQSKSVVASLVAIGLVILFMVGFYVWGGFIAILGMVLNLLMILGAMAFLGATITLPGVAALVLTLGMAVDANILIFERVREEAALGKDRAVALREGYARATWTIIDANLTTLLTALILVFMGSGPIRGFGVTLTIGIFTTVFTSLITCRGLQELALSRGVMSRVFGLPVFRPTIDIPFLKYARIAFIGAWVVIVLGLGLLFQKGKDAFGKDFKGGESALVAVAPGAKVDTGRVVRLAEGLGLPDTTVSVQIPVGGGEPTLRIETELTKDRTKGDFANVTSIVSTLKSQYPECLKDATRPVDQLMLSREAVGGSVSSELRMNAIWSVLLALLGIGIYVTLRFESGFGVAAMVATLHDVLMTVALFVLFGGQFNATLIAAILLIIGYSINDTIVVFDRIREELESNPSRSLRDIIHMAINRTLSRTILTSATVFLCAVALFVFGAGDVRLYGEIFIYGVLTGTFSSIFIASPIFYWWHKGERKGVDDAELPKSYSWEAGSDA